MLKKSVFLRGKRITLTKGRRSRWNPEVVFWVVVWGGGSLGGTVWGKAVVMYSRDF